MFSPNASYRDLVGKAELAWDNERVALNAIAQASGIDTAIYTPLGISTYFSASFFSLSMYVAINEAQANGKKAIVKVSTDLTYNQFQKLLKEFTVNVFLPYEKWEGYEYLGESSVTNL
ncbi:hypothetical protein [Pedobacter nyackensis]|uniref:hypothetical protein n=1 Tax=Pedobacter nyackensis TaxID=475255 RepID=UPI002931672B|nr:hypothetical protein [Pedobacter nyackensis]